MATDAQLNEWTQWGGTIEQKKGRGKANQVFVAPSGTRGLAQRCRAGLPQRVHMRVHACCRVGVVDCVSSTRREDHVVGRRQGLYAQVPGCGADGAMLLHLIVTRTGDNKENMTNKRQKTDAKTEDAVRWAMVYVILSHLSPQEPAPKQSAAKRKSGTPASAPRSAKRVPKAEPKDAGDDVEVKAEAKAEHAPRRRKAENPDDVIMIKEEPAAENEADAVQALGEAEDGMYR